jgi:hypothetical protein
LEILAGGGRRDASLQTPHHIVFPAAAVGVGTVHERNVSLIVDPGLARRKHTHHGIRLVIQAKGFAKDLGVGAEAVLPEFVAENQHPILPAGPVLLIEEVSSEEWRYSHRAKEAGTHLNGCDSFGGTAAGQLASP